MGNFIFILNFLLLYLTPLVLPTIFSDTVLSLLSAWCSDSWDIKQTRQDLSVNQDLVRLVCFLFVPPFPLLNKFCLLFTQTPRSLSPHKWGWFLPDKKYIQIKWKMESAYESSEGKIVPRVAIVSSLLSILIPEYSVNIMFRWMINLQREIIWAVKPSYIWSTSRVAQCLYDMTIMDFSSKVPSFTSIWKVF